MSPAPRRQDPVICPDCGASNDTARGGGKCRNCQYPLPSSDITPFEFPATGQAVRTVIRDGDPWFVAADVTTVLGYGGGARNALVRLPERMKGVEEINTLGGAQKMTIVSESGVYRLVMRSNLPAAEDFQDWIAEEVVPAIRRTGAYSVDQARPADMSKAGWIRQALEIEEERERLAIENAKLRVKAEAFDLWLNGKGCYLVGTVAKMLNLGPKTLWDFLYDEKVLIKAPGTKRHREPYARPEFKGWFEVDPVDPARTNGHATHTTGVTPYGAEQIRLRLIKRGLLPPQQLALIEGSA